MKMCKPNICLFSLSYSLNSSGSSGPSEPDLYTKKRVPLKTSTLKKEKKQEQQPLENDEIANDFVAQQQ
jgi:hypothetical protein